MIKDLLFRNISLKILSLFFAVSLWLFVNLKATAEKLENSMSLMADEIRESLKLEVK